MYILCGLNRSDKFYTTNQASRKRAEARASDGIIIEIAPCLQYK